MSKAVCPERTDDFGHCWHVKARETVAMCANGPPPAVKITKQCCWCGEIQKEMPIYGPDPMHGTKVPVWVPTGKVKIIN